MTESRMNDVRDFRELLARETSKLAELCANWEARVTRELQEEAGDDVCGRIRAAVGKARILMDRKGRFPQFEQLIDNCEFGYGEKKTTCTDLQGFWEMIYFQVEDVVENFNALGRLESRGWKDPAAKPVEKAKSVKPKPRSKPLTVKRTASVGIRALMAAKRKEMAQVVTPKPEVLIEVIETAPEAEERVFEGGFFRVTSPGNPRKNPIPDGSGDRLLGAAFESVHLTPSESSNPSKSTSLPSSSHGTPVKTEDKVRRSLLNSASRRLALSASSSTNRTPYAIMRVTSACRRSMSRENTPAGDQKISITNGDNDLKMILDFDEKENEETEKQADEPVRRSARLVALKEQN